MNILCEHGRQKRSCRSCEGLGVVEHVTDEVAYFDGEGVESVDLDVGTIEAKKLDGQSSTVGGSAGSSAGGGRRKTTTATMKTSMTAYPYSEDLVSVLIKDDVKSAGENGDLESIFVMIV